MINLQIRKKDATVNIEESIRILFMKRPGDGITPDARRNIETLKKKFVQARFESRRTPSVLRRNKNAS